MKIEINNTKYDNLLEASKATQIPIESLKQSVKRGSKTFKRRSDQKIFNFKYDIFNQREIIVDGKSFPNITKAAIAFDLKPYSLQYALKNGKNEIERKKDGKVFSISSKRILNKYIQRKMNELHDRFQISKKDHIPPHVFKEMYEKFCNDFESNYGEPYEPKKEKEPIDLCEIDYIEKYQQKNEEVFHPPSWFKKAKNYALNVDY